MPAIRITQSQSSGLTAGWEQLQSVEIDARPFSEGGFGQIYRCLAVNNASPPVALVIKLFKPDPGGNDRRSYETIRKLQARVRSKQEELAREGKSLAAVPGLYALPQFSFEGQLGHQSVLGYAAHWLDPSYFTSFEDILDHRLDHRFREFLHLDSNLKRQLALELAECFAILRELYYIHADVNPPNLFVNLNRWALGPDRL